MCSISAEGAQGKLPLLLCMAAGSPASLRVDARRQRRLAQHVVRKGWDTMCRCVSADARLRAAGCVASEPTF